MKNKTEIVNIFTRKTLGLTLVLSAAAMAFAQEKAGVSGIIVNKKNQPVPYASVTFSNKANKTLSDAVLTDEKGQYQLQLMPGDYDITVEAIDYKKSVVSKNIAAAGNIGALSIEAEPTSTVDGKTKEIQGVVITASAAKPYKVELDKKTYDPSQDIVSKGGNLQDVLTNVPSVSVDTDGTVSMRGSTNVKFLINGKPSALLGIDDGANALQSIPADQIERIEVITNPSSKFEASGTSGILNIILKKSKKVGFNGSVVGSLGYFPRTSLNTNLSWRKNNWTWFLNGGGGYTENKTKNNSETTYHNLTFPKILPFQQPNDVLAHQLQNSTNKTYNKNYNVSAGFVHDLSDKTSINFTGLVRTFEGDGNELLDTYDSFYRFFRDSPDPSTIAGQWNLLNPTGRRDSKSVFNNLAFQGDLGLDHKFDDKGQNLAVSLSLQKNRSNNNADILETYDLRPDVQDVTRRHSSSKTIIGKADYELPIGEKSKLEAGYRLDVNDNTYDNFVSSTSNNPYIPSYNNNTDYKEVFNAFYLQFKSKIGEKFAYQLGLRDELSNVSINYINQNPNDKRIDKTKNYNNLFPSVFLSYDVSKNNQILLNYSRRIDRPRSFFMVPFPNYSNSQNIFEGNIDLNPSYVDSFEVGYNITRKKFTINPTLYYRHATDDTKMLVYRPDESLGVFYTKPINLGSDDRYGLDLNFTYDPFAWLKIMGSLDMFGYKTSGIAYYDAIDKNKQQQTRNMDFTGNGFSTRARLNTTFRLDKTLSVQLQGFYRGAQKSANQNTQDMYALNLGASKTIWKGDGTISFNIQDIFNTRSREVFSFNEDYTRRNYMQWQPRQFAISLTYRFKQGEKIEQPKKKKDINSNAAGDDQQGGPM
ncbi:MULTISPECIES: TonB-dependent receptor [unclassified Chryseobacterium]|uniref:TonB-dependent receptor n=1 Tax=unclassified Chryseobacterium TaxID=2593645 RepID=UPI001AE7174E|nr:MULTISPECIES: TonB-dependent receptor [unclassified Chryseobacterium]MBP1164772.1 outer membrane receptor protein involved in Fe transport [Chryseobacterium sp. PvR013]MDR4890774.1 TonB-dependent receptor [Chryseobacterium sp. CFS7]